jgi:hypothetical protein
VAPVLAAAPVPPDTDPTALRLALLSHHHRRPVPDDIGGRLRTAWEDDLDVPRVLGVLRSVEEAGPELPDGARFETYAYIDRLLGLELTRDLGALA